MGRKTDEAIMVALTVLLKGKRGKAADEAREKLLDALEKDCGWWPRSDDGRF